MVVVQPLSDPHLIGTVLKNSQSVGGDYSSGGLWRSQVLILPGFVFLWFATRSLTCYLTRFSLLYAYVFFEIVALDAITPTSPCFRSRIAGSLEMEMALALAAAFSLRGLALRFPSAVRAVLVVVIVGAVVHQMGHYRQYARVIVQKLDVTKTMEYHVARWLDSRIWAGIGPSSLPSPDFGSTCLAILPRCIGGHSPFNPNYAVEEAAVYAIYSGQNAGERDAENSILWLKAYGCHAIYVPGTSSRVDGKPFEHPYKFEGVLPVLWHEEDDTIYAVPQRTESLAHVVPLSAIVKRRPIHGLDTAEVAVYVAALDDASLPPAPLVWQDPAHARIQATLHRKQVLSGPKHLRQGLDRNRQWQAGGGDARRDRAQRHSPGL